MVSKNTEKIDILSLTLPQIEQQLVAIGEQKFRAKQIFNWLHQKKATTFTDMTNLSVALQEKLSLYFEIYTLKIVRKLVSSRDDTIKYLYEMNDGERVETVLMSYNHGNSICISSQVGCKMKCAFCASTIAGYVRNLLPSEMLAQIYETIRDSGKEIDSIVIMGIGEPLDNFDNLLVFFDLIKSGTEMSLRHIAVSTCGIVDKINQLAELKLGITLSISLHAVNDEKRSQIMPINKTYNIETLLEACRNYFDITGRRISFEFALISGVNDDAATAKELATLLKSINCHVNLIPVNEVKETGFVRSAYVKEFQKLLTDYGINATIRRTLGSDINAACGQLRRES